jgi:hypothetical protein
LKKQFLILSIVLITFISCKVHLQDIEPQTLMGEYVGIGKGNSATELSIMENNEFKFWIRKGHSSDFTQGTWVISNNNLVLNSKILDSSDSLGFALSNATWIEFIDSEWKIGKDKLTELKNARRKLKKQ